MQPKKQLKVQYIGIFEEIDSFYWPKMHFLKEGQKIRSYAQNVVFDVQKRGPSCPNWGQGRLGGLGDSGNARKKTFFFNWGLPLAQSVNIQLFQY